MRRRHALFFLAAAAALPRRALALADDAAVRDFIRRMRDEHQFVAAELEAFFARMSINQTVLKFTGTPAAPGKKTYWREYRRRRLTAKNIVAGARFYRQNRAGLQRAEATYGVPAAVITAIVGVETKYGAYLGKFSVAEALTTLAFAHPTRGGEFREELAQLLLYAREKRLDATRIFGSYAGAFGMPQFLPSSARRFAVDFDGDGRTDLFNADDTVGSIGNFLKQHGWRGGIGIAYAAQTQGDVAALVRRGAEQGYRAVFTRERLADAGVTFRAPDDDGPYVFIDLENRYDTEYRVGTVNFYALTRYNKSFKYAAAVADLAAAVADSVA